MELDPANGNQRRSTLVVTICNTHSLTFNPIVYSSLTVLAENLFGGWRRFCFGGGRLHDDGRCEEGRAGFDRGCHGRMMRANNLQKSG